MRRLPAPPELRRRCPQPELTLAVTLAVLGAGLLHAGWNALLKAAPGGDPLLDTAAVVTGSSLCGLRRHSIRRRARSRRHGSSPPRRPVMHFGYYVTLAQAYRTGDLSFAYPLMRGTAPLIVTLLGIVFLREWPTLASRVGHCADLGGHREHRVRAPQPASSGSGRMGTRQRRDHRRLHAGRRHRRARIGQCGELCRLAHFPRRVPVPRLDLPPARQGRTRLHRGADWRRGLLGGAASLGAYGIVLWAMTRAPVAAVAALRETSVLFAALIGAVWLKEGFGWRATRRRGERRRRRGSIEAVIEHPSRSTRNRCIHHDTSRPTPASSSSAAASPVRPPPTIWPSSASATSSCSSRAGSRAARRGTPRAWSGRRARHATRRG